MPVIHVDLITGRTVDQKREFAKAVAEAAVTHLHCRREDVKMVLNDLEEYNLADGGNLRCDRK